jgi:hypothetical protein
MVGIKKIVKKNSSLGTRKKRTNSQTWKWWLAFATQAIVMIVGAAFWLGAQQSEINELKNGRISNANNIINMDLKLDEHLNYKALKGIESLAEKYDKFYINNPNFKIN